MSTHRLEKLFAPKSLALIGASPRVGSLGHALLSRIEAGGFPGPLALINPHHAAIEGRDCRSTLLDLKGAPPDLAIIAVPADQVPVCVAQAIEIGVGVSLVVTRGLGPDFRDWTQGLLKKARRGGMRLVGPNGLGVIAPRAKLNASLAAAMPIPGDLALISQSASVAAAILGWACERSIGLSGAISLGDMADVDLDDCLDHFAAHGPTRAILLVIERFGEVRDFMSSARAAARVKPVIVLKVGSDGFDRSDPLTHSAALARETDVYDAAFRRAGLVEVDDLAALFAAAQTLSQVKPFAGARIGIVTNGSGLAWLASRQLERLGGTPARVTDLSAQGLAAASNASDAQSHSGITARYRDATGGMLGDPQIDAVLALHAPNALADPIDAARGVSEAAHAMRGRTVRHKPVFAVAYGADPALAAHYASAQIPSFATEADAARGLMNLVAYSRGVEALMQMPPGLPEHERTDARAARVIVDAALAQGRTWLGPVDVVRLLGCYLIPVTPALAVATPDQAVMAAQGWLDEGRRIAVKIDSPDLAHKSDVGGVVLDIATADDVHETARAMLARVKARRPDIRIDGVTLHPMASRAKAREVICGLVTDPALGPVIVFGRGGTAVEVIDDKAIALPPLDLKLAHALIARTRVSRILAQHRDMPEAANDKVATLLVRLSELATDLPEVLDIDLNPVLADEKGVLVVDARVRIAPLPKGARPPFNPRLAIRPYPREWERQLTMKDGTQVLARPVRPQDETLYPAFFEKVTAQDMRLRFFGIVKDISHAFIARLTQLDYGRAMAWIAVDEGSGAMLGAVRLHADTNRESAEYAVLLRSDLKGQGLGWQLMELMIEYARAEGLRRVEGQVLRENATMIAMCRKLGFKVEVDPDDPDLKKVTLLTEAAGGG